VAGFGPKLAAELRAFLNRPPPEPPQEISAPVPSSDEAQPIIPRANPIEPTHVQES
jgi:hypothetical protein